MKMSPHFQPECVAPTSSNVLLWPLFTWPSLTLSQSWNVEHQPSFRTEHRALASAPPPPKPGELRSLQLECVCCWSRFFFFFFLSDCVGDSGSVPVLVAQAGGYFSTTYVAAIKKKERASIQRAIVTGRVLRDPTEQMLHKLDSFSAFEGEEEMGSKSSSRYTAALFSLVNNQTEPMFCCQSDDDENICFSTSGSSSS